MKDSVALEKRKCGLTRRHLGELCVQQDVYTSNGWHRTGFHTGHRTAHYRLMAQTGHHSRLWLCISVSSTDFHELPVANHKFSCATTPEDITQLDIDSNWND